MYTPHSVTSLDQAALRQSAVAVPGREGPVALLGGHEHRRGTEVIERTLLELLEVTAPHVVVVPAASSPREVGMVSALARTYWTALDTSVSVALPDGGGAEHALAAVADADVIVLPGGVPNRLVARLGASPVWDMVLRRWHAGAALAASSAGAMSLFAWRLRLYPPHPLDLVPSLGPFDGWVAAPHFSRFRAERWAVPAARWLGGLGVLGLDEGTAIIGRDGRFTVAGSGALTVIESGIATTHRPGATINLDLGGHMPTRSRDASVRLEHPLAA